jgi:hypothetical protein
MAAIGAVNTLSICFELTKSETITQIHMPGAVRRHQFGAVQAPFRLPMLNSRATGGSKGQGAALPRAAFAGADNGGLSMRLDMVRQGFTAVAMLVVLGVSGAVVAHHANSAYDRTRTVSVTGVVTRWQFINPHAGIWLDVTDDEGNVVEWSGEFSSVQDLYRHYSWNKNTFQPGDVITIHGNPDRREGHLSMWTSLVVMPDGTEVDVRNLPE